MKRLCTIITLLLTFISVTHGQIQNPHEFRLGVGAGVILDFYGSSPDDYCAPYPSPYFPEYYRGDKIAPPAINLSYSYQFKKWLAFGATLNYAGTFQKTYHLYSDAVDSKESCHFIGVTPTVRFDWFRTSTVKLYSCVGLGLGYYFERESPRLRNEYLDYSYMPTIDLTPLGISVGRKVFGFCELGVSTHGFIKAGIGYRFNDKSKK